MARVKLPTILRSHAGGEKQVDVDGATLREVLSDLETRYPGITITVLTEDGALQGDEDWELQRTVAERGASLGSGAVILGGLRIGRDALVGAGAVVTRDVAAGETVVGNPGRPLR